MYHMKRLTITLILALTLVSAWAQNHFATLLSDLQLVANEHIQNRNEIDSLYYLKTHTYLAPYNSKKAIKKVNDIISQITEVYQLQLPAYSSSYFSSQSLQEPSANQEIKMLSVHYSSAHPNFNIGGKGHNYAIFRKEASNPSYRTISGIEWWRDSTDRVYFKLIDIYGPHSEYHYLKHLSQHNRIQGLAADSLFFHSNLTKMADLPATWRMDYTEYITQSIKILCNIYKGNDSTTDEAIADLVADRLIDYLKSDKCTPEGRVRVLREITIPGFYAEIISNQDTQPLSFADLANQWPNLQIFCTSYEKKGSAACQKYGEKSKHLLLQVYLQ